MRRDAVSQLRRGVALLCAVWVWLLGERQLCVVREACAGVRGVLEPELPLPREGLAHTQDGQELRGYFAEVGPSVVCRRALLLCAVS